MKIRRLFQWTALALAGVMVLAAVRLPDPLARWVLRAGDGDAYAIEARRMRLDPVRGLVADAVKVYRRGVVGPALLEAERVAISINPWRIFRRRPLVDRVAITRGVLRPDLLKVALSAADAPPPEMPPSLPAMEARLLVEDLDVYGVRVRALRVKVLGEGRHCALNDLSVEASQGPHAMRLRGRLATTAEGLEGAGTADGDPRTLLGIFDGFKVPVASDIIRELAFDHESPRWEWNYTQRWAPEADYQVGFRFWMERPRYAGVDALRADGQVVLAGREGAFTATIRPLLVVREEGSAQGGLNIHWHRLEPFYLEYDVVSSLEPRAAAHWIGFWTNEVESLFRFREPYRLESAGRVDLRDPHHHRVELRARLGGFGTGRHEWRDCEFGLWAENGTNRIEGFQGAWFDGSMTGRLHWTYADFDTPPDFELDARVAGADFDRLVAGLGGAQNPDYAGRFSSHLRLDGRAGEPATYTGEGGVRISRGRLFLMPLFGGLTEYISWAIPGVNVVLGQTDAKADFLWQGERLQSDRILIEGDVLSLTGKGSYTLQGDLDAAVQLTFLRSHTLMSKLIRIPTYLVSKLFEFRLTGTTEDPRWFPVNFSKEVWQDRVQGAIDFGGDGGGEDGEPRPRRWWRFWSR